MRDEYLERLRNICLALPEATEDNEGVGSPSFKVRGKIFAMDHPMDNRPSMWCKAPKGLQQVLVDSDSARFFVPPYVGHHGWIGMWFDVEPDWQHITELIEDSYRMTAPKKLVKLLEQRGES